MAMRECLMPSVRQLEAQEEIVADLHHCLEQVQNRTEEIEAKIVRWVTACLLYVKFGHITFGRVSGAPSRPCLTCSRPKGM